MRILVTGAAGRLGRYVRKELAANGHELRLADVRPVDNPEGESRLLDITDGEAVQQAMEGIEAVAHLAMGQWENGDAIALLERHLDVNAKGTYTLLWAAQRAGVRRFVYTSSLSVFGSHAEIGEKGQQQRWDESMPPSPANVYGLSKYYGEMACRFFADQYQLGVVVLRLCHICDEQDWQQAQEVGRTWRGGGHWRAMATHAADIARAVVLALTVPGLRCEILHIAADNPGRVTEIERARQVLGFWPGHRLAD